MANDKLSAYWQKYRPVLEELVRAGLSDRQIAESGKIPGANTSKIKNARHRFGLRGGEFYRGQHLSIPTLTRVVSETPERIVYAPEESDDEPIEEVWERAVRRTQRAVSRAKTEGVALVRIMTDKPIALSISSDWHVSTSGACDLEGLRRYAEAIQQTPGAYAVAVGDLYDNPIKWEKNMRDVPDEVRIVGFLFGIFGWKMLGTTDGNHDAWARQFSGLDSIKQLADAGRIHYAPDELVYVIELVAPKTREVTAKYVVATRHKYRRHSNLNFTHACWRWLEDRVNQWPLGEDGGTLIPDILAIGDNHVAAVESRATPNGARWAARMGPWQVASSFARAKGFGRTPATAPTFILYPHRAKPIAGFEDYAQALDFLAQERAGSVRAA